MTQPIDTAYVDIVARDKSLAKLRKDIDNTFDDIDKDIKKSLNEIDQNFEDTFAEIDTHFKTMTIRTKKAFEDVEEQADTTFKRIRRKFTEPLQRGFEKLTEIVSETGRVIGQIGSGLGSFASSSPLLVLILALTPAIIGLAAALSQLIGIVGVIPAGLGVLLSTLIPVIIAFQNFGDAVSALAEGDVDKINEALKKLSPSAAIVAREISNLLPVLRGFQRTVQEGFFAPIVGDITNLTKRLLPTLQKGFFDIAQAMGRFTSGFAELLANPNTIQVFQELFASTASIITGLSGPILRFVNMLFNTIHESLPFVERLAGAFGRALDAFSAFVNKSIETGDFDAFIEDAITTIKELIDLLKASFGLIGTLFGATEDEGHDLIKSLTDMIKRLDDFFKTAEGQDALEILAFAIKAVGFVLSTTLDTLIFFWRVMKNTLDGFAMAGKGIISFVTMIIEWIKKVPAAVTTFLSGIPDAVAGFFQRMIDQTLQILGIGIGLILFIIQELPNQIATFLISLPQRIYDILVPIIDFVGRVFEGAVNFGKNFVINGFNEIIAFIASVPGRIRSLMPNFSSAGKNLIDSFMNGFRSVGSFIGDVAGDIVKSVKGFLNKAIDRINSGIETIDNVLPGSLARIPRLAQGAFVSRRPGGILANIGEGSEDEWVLPQSKLEQVAQGGGQTITFGPGAINVNFTGTVPTAQEAREVGTAVGQGIVDMMTRRNMRVQVRAV